MKIPIRYIIYLLLGAALFTYLIIRKIEPVKPVNITERASTQPAKPLSEPVFSEPQLKSKQPAFKDIKGPPNLETFLSSKDFLTQDEINMTKAQLLYLRARDKYEDALRLANDIYNKIKDDNLRGDFNKWLEEFKQQQEKILASDPFYDPEVDKLIQEFKDALIVTDSIESFNALSDKPLSRSQVKSLTRFFWETGDDMKKEFIILLVGGAYPDDRELTNFLKEIVVKEEAPRLRQFAVSELGRRDLKEDDYEFITKLYESDADPEVREEAWFILKYTEKKEELIGEGLNSKDPLKRKLAIESLDTSDRKTRQVILNGRTDPSPIVREEAYRRLIYDYALPYASESMLDDEEAIKAIINGFINDSDKDVRESILLFLSSEADRIKSSGYKSDFEIAFEKSMRNDPDERVRFWATYAWAFLKDIPIDDD